MRAVYPTREVIHLWAHQTQERARNQQGNVYFQGATIYSYGEHFPMARIINGRAVLINERRYSRTTAKHLSWVRNACVGVRIEVPDPGISPERNLREMLKRIGKLLADIGATKRYRGRAADIAEAQERIARAQKLASAFDLDASGIPSVDDDTCESFARAAAEAKATAERRALRELQAQARKEKKRMAEWLSIPAREVPKSAHYLRLSADGDVETSQGARVPLAHVKRAWRLIVKCWQEGIAPPVDARIGHYPLDRIDAAGTVFVGCHAFSLAEVERFAAVLGLSRAEVSHG